MTTPCIVRLCFAMLCFTSVASAQFDTVIDVPPGSLESPLQSNTLVNVTGLETRPTVRLAPGASNIEFNLMGGEVDSIVQGGDHSEVLINVSGGEYGAMDLGQGVTFRQSDGVHSGVFRRLFVSHADEVSISGGVVGSLGSTATPTSISGGQVKGVWVAEGILTVTGGEIGVATLSRDGIAHISDGTIGTLEAHVGSVVNISGGSFERVSGSSTLNVTGGYFERFLTDVFSLTDSMRATSSLAVATSISSMKGGDTLVFMVR